MTGRMRFGQGMTAALAMSAALGLGGGAFGPRPAAAQGTAPGAAPQAAAPGAPPAWTFSVTPYGWFPGLSGSLETPLPRLGDRGFDVGSGTVVTNLDSVPVMIAGEARYGRFALLGDVFYASLRQDLDPPRDRFFTGGHTRVTSTIVTLAGMVRVLEEPKQALDLGAGARIWNIETKVSLTAGTLPGAIQTASATWSDPILAARYQATLSPRLGATLYGDIGGFSAGSTLTWQAMGSLDYSLTERTTLRWGWRYLSVDRSRGAFAVDLGFNGPFVAASFRF